MSIVIFKCREEVQADLERQTSSVYTPLDPEIKADVSERCLPFLGAA